MIKILLAAIRSVAKPINEIECSGQEFAPAWPLRSLFPTLATIELDGSLENRGQDLTCLDNIKPHPRNCTGPCTRWWMVVRAPGARRPACRNAAQWCPSAGWGGGRFSASLLARSRSRRWIRSEVMVAAGMIFSFCFQGSNPGRLAQAWEAMERDGVRGEDHTHNSVR